MTIEFDKSRLHQGKIPKIVFESVEDAKIALQADKAACVYVSAREVTVITAYGSGKFKKEDWDRK